MQLSNNSVWLVAQHVVPGMDTMILRHCSFVELQAGHEVLKVADKNIVKDSTSAVPGLFLFFGSDDPLSLGEVSVELIQHLHFSLVPRMVLDGVDVQSFLRLKREHAVYQVLERVSEEPGWFALSMSSPEDGVLLGSEHFVVGIVGDGLFEGRATCIHHEEDNGSGKQIHLLAVIVLGSDLWGHVTFSTELGFENTSSKEGGEAKVCQPQSEVGIEQDIFRLDVPMADARVVAVLQSVDEHVEVGASGGLTEATTQSNVFEELASICIL